MNFFILLLTVLPALLAVVLAILPGSILSLFIQPKIEGFFCGDESIRLPQKPDSFTNRMLAMFVFLPFFTVAIFCEAIQGYLSYKDHKQQLVINHRHLQSDSNKSDLKAAQKRYIVSTLQTFGHLTFCYIYGHCFIFSLVFITKFTVGRPRPSFIDVCKPIYLSRNFTCDGTVATKHIYVDNYECESEDSRTMTIIDARREIKTSFPSGHAALAIYSAVFIAIYLQNLKNCNKFVRLARIVTQSYILLVAFYAAVSRVSDHRHHATDVLGGLAIGVTVGLLMMIHLKNKSAVANRAITCYNGSGHVNEFEQKT
ncbi:hypothetical protein HELRODRAFT_193353 [Helobdella robusta]|uniref:Phosphatidic acid phosphatase type 2/haloperoxidase domain-containing protein n=1 Tax=Helobdella robusta TaxID=6412 RepID=T1FUW6_HELRO|nr:hypothetical protein HELRODRAFT_193353 [Helobdella robusta]ESN97052.1 hypothetical protein HELRODRAFT_193353 [Helobdella robusta]